MDIERMSADDVFLFRWTFICLLVCAIIATIAIINQSVPVGLASLVWLGLAAVFTRSRKQLSKLG